MSTSSNSSDSLSKTKAKTALTQAQKEMYAAEKLMNFRWIAKVLATCSSYTLTTKDMADESLFTELAEIGQFTELAYANVVPVSFLFRHQTSLMKPDFPLEGYNAFEGSMLVSEFFGKVAHLHGYVAYRPKTKQLVVAISGTSGGVRGLPQAVQDLRTLPHRHKSRQGLVHSGFWQLYKGIRPFVLDGLRKGFEAHGDEGIQELVVTGHSMGGAVSYLLLLDQLLVSNDILRPNLPIKLVVFGAPRPGDSHCAEYYRELIDKYRKENGGESAFTEYLVKAYNDGVPALPPLFLGYRHFTQKPLYYDHNRLYHIPSSEFEHTLFHVDADKSIQYPRGGHNYYNGRDQEALLRRLGWLEKSLAEAKAKAGIKTETLDRDDITENWEHFYLERVKKHQGFYSKVTSSSFYR
ncbi:hypothetical protein D9757_005928 [Collybiopsis confluens]|uniref:Fungal lipase-type domain-containing protein n=1 Tax=Collybiopsis confluens TaxID=2823264 RepID=A0A8H5HN80_9AGAR|nr:hypothetical protein D9757_005928 [Collybiopsis confluens]